MSQEIFSVADDVECLVGWDVPMQTFFGQVYRVDEKGERAEDEPILWVGKKPEAIRTVDHLQELLRPRTVIPPVIRRRLFEIEID
ncbi:MAG: hypothetical protein ABI430_00275 [Candidatus Taylorbacteria bacterium]